MRWSPGTGDGPTAYVLDLLAPSTRAVIATAQFGLDRRFFSATVAQGTYVLRLTAVNACGATQWPAESTLLVGTAAPTLPGLPGQPAAVVAAHAVTLNWTAPAAGPAPSHYVIEAVDGSDNVLLTVNTGNASTTFSHSSVPAGEYRVRVRAANGAGLGLPSTAVHITVAP
jgi:predicted phage tail protein